MGSRILLMVIFNRLLVSIRQVRILLAEPLITLSGPAQMNLVWENLICVRVTIGQFERVLGISDGLSTQIANGLQPSRTGLVLNKGDFTVFKSENRAGRCAPQGKNFIISGDRRSPSLGPFETNLIESRAAAIEILPVFSIAVICS
jgi:hypothetical protein